MTMSQATLKAELIAMDLYGTESAAIEAWAEAFTTYFEDAESEDTQVPVIVAALRAGGGPKDQMKSSMSGMSGSGQGATKITAGITSFWSPMISAPGTYFAGATAMTAPPGLAGLTATLEATFDTNTSTKASEDDAMDAIATDIHGANAGGTVTLPGPVVENIV